MVIVENNKREYIPPTFIGITSKNKISIGSLVPSSARYEINKK